MAVSAEPKAAALGEDFVAAAERALASGKLDGVPDVELERVLTAAVRLYAAKADTDRPPATADHAVKRDADRRRGDGERPDPRGRAQSLGRVDVVQPDEAVNRMIVWRSSARE